MHGACARWIHEGNCRTRCHGVRRLVRGGGVRPRRPAEAADRSRVHTGPGGGSDLLARAVALMVEKEKLLPLRMQVVNKTGGGAAVAAAYLAEKKGDPNTIGFITGVWLTSPLTSAEARVSLK